jgi:copper chaperone CopZ/uncharacterized membrane protein
LAAGKISEDEAQGLKDVDTTACCRGARSQTAQFDTVANQYSAVALTIKGMHCGSCIGRIKTALAALDGVADVYVDIATGKATVRYSPAIVGMENLKAAVISAGYEIVGNAPDDFRLKAVPTCREHLADFSNPRAYFLGVLAAFAIVGIYLGMNTLTSDWYFAKVQFSENRWWIISLAIGLGIQVSLYSLFRGYHRGKNKTAANSSLAASGGVSVVAMMACCSHYLATLIPLLGVSFLSAAAVANIAQYQPYFFLAGIASCLLGIGFMVRMMRKHGMFAPAAHKR